MEFAGSAGSTLTAVRPIRPDWALQGAQEEAVHYGRWLKELRVPYEHGSLATEQTASLFLRAVGRHLFMATVADDLLAVHGALFRGEDSAMPHARRRLETMSQPVSLDLEAVAGTRYFAEGEEQRRARVEDGFIEMRTAIRSAIDEVRAGLESQNASPTLQARLLGPYRKEAMRVVRRASLLAQSDVEARFARADERFRTAYARAQTVVTDLNQQVSGQRPAVQAVLRPALQQRDPLTRLDNATLVQQTLAWRADHVAEDDDRLLGEPVFVRPPLDPDPSSVTNGQQPKSPYEAQVQYGILASFERRVRNQEFDLVGSAGLNAEVGLGLVSEPGPSL